MTRVDPNLPLAEATNIPKDLKQKLKSQKVTELTQLFQAEKKLQDAITLAEKTGLSVQEAIKIRYQGRRYIETLLEGITTKRKIEPLALLWKLHWLLGVVPEGDQRKELLVLEASAISTLLETFDTASAPAIEQLLRILLHRQLIISDTIRQGEINQLIEFTEQYQKKSLLAYQITKAKTTLSALSQANEPTKLIVELRKIGNHWKRLHQIMQERNDKMGIRILTALQAKDSLRVLDISQEHLRDRLQQTMSTKKLRQSQLTHITTIMNAAIDLDDAYLAAHYAARASQIWFELAQVKPGETLSDDLLRSLRFARTAIFHYRVLDDSKGAVHQLEHLIHLLGEISSAGPAPLEEAVTGALNTFIGTLSLLDRPADQTLILKAAQRFDTVIGRLEKQLTSPESRHNLASQQMKFQQSALRQLHNIGAEESVIRGFRLERIYGLLRLIDAAPETEQATLIEQVVEEANALIPTSKPISNIGDQELKVISSVSARLAQRPKDELSEAAKQLVETSHQLNEQVYFQTKDPQVKAQLALQLLLSKISPDPTGTIHATFSTKELDKLEEYAATALITHVKAKEANPVLKAGSILVWVILQRMNLTKTQDDVLKLKEDARDFVEKTYAFMPPPNQLSEDGYPFAFLLLRSVNDLVLNERPSDESQWEPLLTQSESFAQALSKIALTHDNIGHQILAMSAAGTATAKLATLSTSDSQRSRLLKRATTQMQKALQAATADASPKDIEAVLAQYDHLLQAQLTTTPTISAQISLFKEWDETYSEAVKAIRKTGEDDVANSLEAYRILNAKVPLVFSSLQQASASPDSVKRQIIELLREVNEIGSPQQSKLAKQLERRWAFQLGEDSLIASGYRLEDAETSFTLADEHFRISLQVEPQISINGKNLRKIRSFPFLRPASQLNGLTWYDENPVICTLYSDNKLHTWLTLQNPTEQKVSIGYWFIASEKVTATVTLQILGIETLSQDSAGVVVQLSGAQLSVAKQPLVAEHRESKGVLVYELHLTTGYPDPLSLDITVD
jgi:hypothetical protein